MARTIELPDWLTVEEFAHHFRIGKTLAYQEIRANGESLGVRRFGRTIRIPRSALERDSSAKLLAAGTGKRVVKKALP